MTKLQEPLSLEHAIHRCFRILGEDGVRRALARHLGVERSASLIRKCANPDDPAHHLQVRYAVALDRACWEARRTHPVLEAYQHVLAADCPGTGAGPDASKEAILDAVVDLQASLGDLAHLVRDAYSRANADPAHLSRAAQSHIYEAIDLLESHAEMFKALIAQG